jgi:hypothetical protein
MACEKCGPSGDVGTYIARCRECKQITGATVDEPERTKDCAKDVREFVAHGSTVERVTVCYVRHSAGDSWGCRCPKAKRAKVASR